MSKRTVTHGTFVIERDYPVPPERVFAAFADTNQKRRWFAGQKNLDGGGFEMDFRPGGRERTQSVIPGGPLKGATMVNETVYQDIAPDARIVMAYTMTINDRRISASLATIEFLASDKGTRLIFTEQGAYFEGSDGPQMREGGWRQLLESLAQEIGRV